MSIAQWNREKKEASLYTKAVNRLFGEELGIDLEDATNEEYELAKTHCLKKVDELVIKDANGNVVWNTKAFDFLKEKKVPDTVNPSLWLNGKSNALAGVFSVVEDKIIQVRGFDIANLTLVRGKTGWIAVDVTTTVEVAKASIELVEEVLGEDIHNNIKAIIISHSHVDHYGGIKGVVDEEKVGKAEDGKVPIYVPAGFDIETVKENVYAGGAMLRRSEYQFASRQEIGEKGIVSVGLGLKVSRGTVSYITPTDFVAENQTIVIDGLEVEFQLTPGTEAPSEMNNYFKEYKAFWAAENCCGTLHNLYPIRGAHVRDASAWSKYTRDALIQYGEESDVVFQSHNWPHWNTKEQPTLVKDYLRNNAAIYQFIHDQTLLYANQGYTAREIAKKIKVPKDIAKNWFIRPYYGSIEINARAVYQKYLGFYNANPVTLNPLTEVEEAKQFVSYVGSEEAILKKAKEEFEQGKYQSVAEVTNKVVFANPDNIEARYLCADALEQLAYQSESGIWRNAYITGAQELRDGREKPTNLENKESDIAKNMTIPMILEYLGIVIDGDLAGEEDLKFNLQIVQPSSKDAKGIEEKSNAVLAETDNKTTYLGNEATIVNQIFVHLYKGTLLFYEDYQETSEPIPYVKTTREIFFALVGKKIQAVKQYIETDDFSALERLQDYVVDLGESRGFNIVEA
ncbi:alkyl/aryl-sulfatase [Anaerosporobacter sp.]|uniref:alkyl/aryl-sulfatase n=1 Tax=Anaerosporobacter sp. TaxID=1872529 RepID=UPI00286F3F45|nr:alkyl sulfatase dimerization domain-containing protein [Anaerosporobacter sp.]